MKYKGRHEKESTSDRKRKGRDSRGMKSGGSPRSDASEPDEWGGIDGIPAAGKPSLAPCKQCTFPFYSLRTLHR